MEYNYCEIYRKCCKCGVSLDSNNSLHRFPKPGKTNVIHAKAWAIYCWPEQKSWSLESLQKVHSSHKMLCSAHFRDSCFTENGSKTKLRKFSVPGDSEFVIGLMSKLRKEMRTSENNRIVHKEITQPEPVPSTSTIQSENSCSVHKEITQTEPVPSTSKSQENMASRGILSSIHATRVDHLNETEKILYKQCKRYTNQLRRFKQKVRHKKKADIIQNLKENNALKKLLDLNISDSLGLLLASEIKNRPKKKNARRYNIDLKIMALTIYKKSPACYRLLRRLFSLPCQKTLNRLMNRIPLHAGINEHIFNSLKKMTAGQMDEDNIAILSFDEMAIRKHLSYNENKDVIEGFEDHGNHGRSNQFASNALVFMVAGIRKKFKQPVAFYFSGKSFNSDRLTTLIKEVITKCEESGLKIVSTVCDMSAVNIKALEKLGSSTENPYILFNDKEIVNIYDPPHLLKCTRNLFMKYDVLCQTNVEVDGVKLEGLAKWSHVRLFYELDKTNANFVFAPKLTEQHLNPNNKQKMRVKLASQVFSHAVTAGLLAKIASGELPSEAHCTATFLHKFDELFDSLNADSRDLRSGKKFSTNLTNRSPHNQLFKEMKLFIKNMAFIGSRSTPPSQTGWIRTINAVERLWQNLRALGIKGLATRRLNQDPLENCFGCIRYHCGSNDNPTITQFIAGIKSAIINNLKHTGQKTNCEADAATLNDNLKEFLLSEKSDDQKPDLSENPTQETFSFNLVEMTWEAAETVSQATAEAQACSYVCGFIFKNITKNNCNECVKSFLVDIDSGQIQSTHIFTSLREYSDKEKLNYVTNDFVICVETCATIINNFLIEHSHITNLKKTIYDLLSEVDFQFIMCKEHLNEKIDLVKETVFYIVLKRYLTIQNRDLANDYKHKSLQKKINILNNK